MGLERQRNEDYFFHNVNLEDIKEINDRSIRLVGKSKYISLSSQNFDSLFDKIKMLKNSDVDLHGKLFLINFDKGPYLTEEQTKKLFQVRDGLLKIGANLKVKDGDYWDLEEVLTVSTKIDEVVEKIKSATIEEHGQKRSLNEMEKFLWAYSFVANRKYRSNDLDFDASRKITSIFHTGDCVCVGFAAILKELCSKLGIECYMNSVQVNNKNNQFSEGHHNNIVVLDGAAYYCDACWDCVSDKRRPRRTFANCLNSFEDVKDLPDCTITAPSAPFCDMVGDLKDLEGKLKYIEQMDSLTEEDFKNFTNYKNIIGRYLNLVPQYEVAHTELSKSNFKEKTIYYYKQVKQLIEKRQKKEPFQVKDFETALTNIYKAMGNSEEKAQEKTKLDIDATIVEAGLMYDKNSNNCFAQEYYNQVEV